MSLKERVNGIAQKCGRKVAAGLAIAGATLGAGAQVVVPTLDPIVPPIDIDSVTGEVSTFGGTILLAWAGLFIGFGLAYKLVRRLKGTV